MGGVRHPPHPSAHVGALHPVAAPPAVGDGLDGLRAEIRAHTPRPREQKLADALRELQEREARELRRFKDAKSKGGLRPTGWQGNGGGARPAGHAAPPTLSRRSTPHLAPQAIRRAWMLQKHRGCL